MPDLESPDLFPDRRENQEKQKNCYTKSQSNEQRSYNVRLIANGIWSRGIKCILEPDEGPAPDYCNQKESDCGFLFHTTP